MGFIAQVEFGGNVPVLTSVLLKRGPTVPANKRIRVVTIVMCILSDDFNAHTYLIPWPSTHARTHARTHANVPTVVVMDLRLPDEMQRHLLKALLC